MIRMAKKIFLISATFLAVVVFFSFNILANRQQFSAYNDGLEHLDWNELQSQLNGSENKREILYKTLIGILKNAHYSPKDIDDEFSKTIFDNYLDRIDYAKTFFLDEDIKNFSAYKYQLDDEILNGSDEFFIVVQKKYNVRKKQAETFATKYLSYDFKYDENDEIELDYKKMEWAKDAPDLESRWRKNIKYRILNRFNELAEGQKDAKEKKSDKELWAEAQKSTQKNIEYYFRRINKITEDEQFSYYLNVITQTFDPHTTYLAPKDKKRFDEEMSGSFFGIGAVLSLKESICEISQIMPGSPAEKQGQLRVGDGILKVAQGDEEPVDVVGWDLEDIVSIIRGKENTIVKLTVKHADGSSQIIPIKRGQVVISETFAHSIIIKSENHKIGLIDLPSFYADFSDRNGRRCATDMKAEIEKLKDEGVDGIVIDLRNNGGGSLSDVVDIAGYFIPEGPVVMVRSQNSRPRPLDDRDESVLYNGPLAILINGNSASASEILAAAMQDYKRAVILGTTSFGKGTVQQVLNLNDYFKANTDAGDLGNLKLTTQKFYRINGGSTQLKGVEPDIHIPSTFELLDVGERKDKSSMAWDQVASADYTPFPLNFSNLIKKSSNRIAADKQFALIKENALRLKKQSEDNRYSLNKTKYQEQMIAANKISKDFEKLQETSTKLAVIDLKETKAEIGSDSVKIRKNNDWRKEVERDPYIHEAVNVLNDWIATLPKQVSKK